MPDSTVSALAVEEEAHKTKNEPISVGTCTMAGTDATVKSLYVAVDLYSGGDASSADAFADDDMSDRCASLAARAEGSYLDGDARCSAVTPDPGGEATTVVATIPGSHGVARVDVVHVKGASERVKDEVEALVDSLVVRSADDWT